MEKNESHDFLVPFDLTKYIGRRLVSDALRMKVLWIGRQKICPEYINIQCNAKESRLRCKNCGMLKYGRSHEFRTTDGKCDRILLFFKASNLTPTEKISYMAGINREKCRTWRYEVTRYMSVRPVLVDWRGEVFYIYYVGETILERDEEYILTAIVIADGKGVNLLVDDKGLRKVGEEISEYTKEDESLPALDDENDEETVGQPKTRRRNLHILAREKLTSLITR